jgi:type IV fimbrial biogenesis protein FimU
MDFGSRVRQLTAHRGLGSPGFPRHSRGFTLIELIVTVVIVGIFAAIAIPSFTSLIHRSSVTSAANEFYDLLQYARGEAITRTTGIIVSAPSSNSSAWNGDVTVKVVSTTDVSTLRDIGAAGLQTGVTITTTVGNVLFSPTGTAGTASCFRFTSTGDATVPTRFVAVQGSGRITAPSTVAPATGECP